MIIYSQLHNTWLCYKSVQFSLAVIRIDESVLWCIHLSQSLCECFVCVRVFCVKAFVDQDSNKQHIEQLESCSPLLKTLDLVFCISAIHQPFYISICLSFTPILAVNFSDQFILLWKFTTQLCHHSWQNLEANLCINFPNSQVILSQSVSKELFWEIFQKWSSLLGDNISMNTL